MKRVVVICEGQTEETFVNEVLVHPLANKGVYLSAALIGKPGHKGGNFQIQRLSRDIRAILLADSNAFCTTFFDFYGLPTDFPGKQAAESLATTQAKSACLLQALTEVLEERLGQEPMRRFIPYVQMYEFEGLLFSDPNGLANGIDQNSLVPSLSAIREEFETPEDINDSRITAPSKRITQLFSQYEKPIHGSLAALAIGLPKIRQECPLFDAWLKQLESL